MRKAFLAVVTTCGLLSAASGPPAFAATKLSFAFVTDPTHEMYVYAIRKGIVRMESVEEGQSMLDDEGLLAG